MMIIKQKKRTLGLTKPSSSFNRFWWLKSTKVELSFILLNKHLNGKHHSSALQILNHHYSHSNPIHQYYYCLHCSDEKTEAQKGLATCQGQELCSDLNTVLEFSL